MVALFAAASKDYLSLINTWKGLLELDGFPVTVEEVVMEMSDLY